MFTLKSVLLTISKWVDIKDIKRCKVVRIKVVQMGELTSDIVAAVGLLSFCVNALLFRLHMLSHQNTCWMNRFHL